MSNKPYQKEYEAYMKTVTDGFAKICNMTSTDAFAPKVPKDSVRFATYLAKEKVQILANNLHFREREFLGGNEHIEEFHEAKQKIANDFLEKHKLSYDDWFYNRKAPQHLYYSADVEDDAVGYFKIIKLLERDTCIVQEILIAESWALMDMHSMERTSKIHKCTPITKVEYYTAGNKVADFAQKKLK